MVVEAEAADTAGAADTGTTDDPLLSRIESVLEKDVRPGLREDGGDVVVVGLDKDNILQVRLTGACQGMFVVDHDIDHESGGNPQGPGARDPLRRGGSVTAAAPGKAADPRWRWPRAAYVHIPFCARCGYCDFASLAGVDHLADRYLAALECEIETSLVEPQEVDTIFVGGGTPTRLDAAQLATLCAMIKKWFVLSGDGEWTVEANPGTIDAEKADVLARAGVDRISLGAQSFQPGLLAVLEREHGRDQVEQALEVVRPRFARWSLDLIFGVPAQPRNSGATTSKRRSRWVHLISRATDWSSKRAPRFGAGSKAAWSSP